MICAYCPKPGVVHARIDAAGLVNVDFPMVLVCADHRPRWKIMSMVSDDGGERPLTEEERESLSEFPGVTLPPR